MSRPLRVLSLYEGFFAGGARILHSDLVAGLQERGQEHAVLSLSSAADREDTLQPLADDPRYRRLVAAGVAIAALDRTAGSRPPERTSFTADELQIAADAIAWADVVLTLKEQPLGLLLALEDRGMLPDVPVITCLHRSDPTHSGPALGWLVEGTATGIVSATLSCAESTSGAYVRAGAASGARFVVPNGIDTERFRPGTAEEDRTTRTRLGIPSGVPVVLFAARFDAMKDPGLFLRSVALHGEDSTDTHYVLCGAGMTWDNPAFCALAEESGVGRSSRVNALGLVDDMPSLHRIADVVALTSAFGEASPLCLVEGAACGATPVTTDVGDAARIVDGIGLVTPRDAGAIAAAWTSVLDRRGEWRDAALAARHRLGRDRMIAAYETVMADVLSSRTSDAVALAG